MSKKAENRFVRYQTEFYNRKAEERRAAKSWDKLCRDMDDMEEENIALRERVTVLGSAVEKRGVYLEASRERIKELWEEIEHLKRDRHGWIVAFLSVRSAHQKLSEIVRFALSPEQYHQAREIVLGEEVSCQG